MLCQKNNANFVTNRLFLDQKEAKLCIQKTALGAKVINFFGNDRRFVA
jgi:hypothetical protein